ncbi:hypothetical protein MTO96_009703 [Rhipicephalus appendiculatus]
MVMKLKLNVKLYRKADDHRINMKFRMSITVDRPDSPSWCVSGTRRNGPRFAAPGYCQGGTGADSGAWGLAALCWPGSFAAPTRSCPVQEKRPGASRPRLTAADD